MKLFSFFKKKKPEMTFEVMPDGNVKVSVDGKYKATLITFSKERVEELQKLAGIRQ